MDLAARRATELDAVLARADPEDHLRVIVRLSVSGSEHPMPPPARAVPADRMARRQQLMAQNLNAKRAQFASTHAALGRLPLRVSGGEATEFAVLEGPASAIAEARRLPGIASMWLDHDIVI